MNGIETLCAISRLVREAGRDTKSLMRTHAALVTAEYLVEVALQMRGVDTSSLQKNSEKGMDFGDYIMDQNRLEERW